MNNDMSTGVLRQRRNLLLLCAILAFYKMADVDLGSASSLVNATPISVSIGIKNISAIYWGLLGLTFYFWVRYIQYFFAFVYPETTNYIKNIYYASAELYLIKSNLLSAEELRELENLSSLLKQRILATKLQENSISSSKHTFWMLRTIIKFMFFDPYILNYWMPLILPVGAMIYFLV
ncbi:hypothetical protein OAO18_00040 [Francisellaceae bacterium]|nr:hypothetical protein [Francisellaceae bacterium]